MKINTKQGRRATDVFSGDEFGKKMACGVKKEEHNIFRIFYFTYCI
jgi:hypothetical protein